MTLEVALVLGVLLVTIIFFVTEVLRADVVALLVLVALPWLGLIEPEEAFRGFSSAAVISIMAVIIMGHGLDRAGVPRQIARWLKRLAGRGPRRLLATLLVTVGTLSAFIQNVGAAALFLPVAARLGRSGVLRVSQIMMPLGFAAILGGTLTMIGSSPLIVLNDLVITQGYEPFGLFAVTPIGLALLGAGVAFLALFGFRLLPAGQRGLEDVTERETVLDAWPLLDNIEEAMVEEGSSLIGKTRHEAGLIKRYGVHVVAVRELGRTAFAPSGDTRFAAGQRLALLGEAEYIQLLALDCGLRLRPKKAGRRPLVQPESNLYAEVLVAPGSMAVGKTIREVGLRRNYSVDPLALLTGGEHHVRGFANRPLRAGDIILLHGRWEKLRHIAQERTFIMLTQLAESTADTAKALRAVICFVVAILLALAGASLPVALLSGAIAMILLRVMTIDQAYRAINWRTVFLLAGLIPLGIAMESTGAAAYLAEKLFQLVGDTHPLVVMSAVALLASVFTLFMSNVATTVVLVPLVMGLGKLTGLDPRAMALLVAVCAQNSFVLPTHQVNALLMASGGYRNADYLRLGSMLSAMFLVIAVGGVYLIWM